jgi:mRNA interferase RelE/StbE
MGKYAVKIGSAASREIKKLDRQIQVQVIECLDAMQTDPRPKGIEKLSQNPRFYRVRTGDYRLIYNVDDKLSVIYVVLVRHRRDAYRAIEDLDAKLINAMFAPSSPPAP